LVVGLAAGWVVTIEVAGWDTHVNLSHPGPERTEAKLRQIASTTHTPTSRERFQVPCLVSLVTGRVPASPIAEGIAVDEGISRVCLC
jgi:hypothetical protein